MHHVVTNYSDLVELFSKYFLIYFEVRFFPQFWIFKSRIYSQRLNLDRLYNPFAVRWINDTNKLIFRKFSIYQLTNMIFRFQIVKEKVLTTA